MSSYRYQVFINVVFLAAIHILVLADADSVCVRDESCEQLCAPAENGFSCSCVQGYRQDPADNKRCKALDRDIKAVFCDKQTIRSFDLQSRTLTTLVPNLRHATALDYHLGRQLFLWSDIVLDQILMVPMSNSSDIQTIFSGASTPDGMCVDWIHDNVYWTDTGDDTVNVAPLAQNSQRTTLFQEKLGEPRAIVVNPLDGWMYWTDWGDNACIERAGMDGTRRKVIVQINSGWPNGLAIDTITQKLYWADAKTHHLSSCDYDGSFQKRILETESQINRPFGLDTFEGYLYWSDWRAGTLNRVDKFQTSDIQLLHNRVPEIRGLKIFHTNKQPNGTNRCGVNKGGCSHLCLPTPQPQASGQAEFVCACPDNYTMLRDQKTCIRRDLNCGRPRSIPNGNVFIEDGTFTYGSIILYRCNSNYTLNGDDMRTCTANGTWSGTEPTCIDKTETDVIYPRIPDAKDEDVEQPVMENKMQTYSSIDAHSSSARSGKEQTNTSGVGSGVAIFFGVAVAIGILIAVAYFVKTRRNDIFTFRTLRNSSYPNSDRTHYKVSKGNSADLEHLHDDDQ